MKLCFNRAANLHPVPQASGRVVRVVAARRDGSWSFTAFPGRPAPLSFVYATATSASQTDRRRRCARRSGRRCLPLAGSFRTNDPSCRLPKESKPVRWRHCSPLREDDRTPDPHLGESPHDDPGYRLAAQGRRDVEDERLGFLEQLFDPLSQERRDLVRPGWRACLEVGAGRGSMAVWLAEKSARPVRLSRPMSIRLISSD